MPLTYNLNPSPRSGYGAFGAVPGMLTLPDPAADLGRQYPNLGGTNAAVSSNIMAGLQGELSPATMNALQDANAAFGISSGMPGSGFVGNRLGRNIGLTAEALKNQAMQQYASIIPTISGTQTVSPTLQAEIAHQNAVNAAAPDPAQAQSYAMSLFNRYLQGMSGPGGGTRIASGGYGRGGGQGNPTAGPAAGDNLGMFVLNSLSNDILSGGRPMQPEGPQYYTPSRGTGGYYYAGESMGDLSPDEFYMGTGIDPNDLAGLGMDAGDFLGEP